MIRYRQALVYVAACALAAFAVNASADNSQQTKMTTCNASAKGLTGDARKQFMSSCLSNTPAAPPAAPLNSQQQKMKDCNAGAKGLTGDARKQFMSNCLKGS